MPKSSQSPPKNTGLSLRICLRCCIFLQIAATAKGSSQFSSFLKDPTVPRKQRKDTLDEVLKKMEACDMTKNFIGTNLLTMSTIKGNMTSQ